MTCMCSIYQKFYSALKQLDSISIKNEFFDNVSAFDSFFNEFRSITFALQNTFGHDSEIMKTYDDLKNRYLLSQNMKWCNNTRVDVTHKKPFQLNKIIDVNIYYIDISRTKIHHSFDIAINDMSFKEITDEIVNEFSKIETIEPEIYFTINYHFLDSKENIDVFENINDILLNMNNFLIEFEKVISKECNNCQLLKEKINEKFNRIILKNIEFQKDGVFNVKTKKIKFGCNTVFAFGNKDNTIIKNPRISIKDNPIFKGENLEELFFSFIANHLFIYLIQKKHIMPTFFIFFNDDTFTVKSILFDNKATMYKQVNNIASNVSKENITAVFLVNEVFGYNCVDTKIMSLPYEERILHSNIEYLSFSMITSKLEEKYYLIDIRKIDDEKSIINILSNLNNYEAKCTINILNPVKLSFRNNNH